jgi:hypothetical protein
MGMLVVAVTAMRNCMEALVLVRGIKTVIGFLNFVKRWTWSLETIFYEKRIRPDNV